MFLFFFKQKTAYEMRISDWSSDVCSSDLVKESGAAEMPFFRMKVRLKREIVTMGVPGIDPARDAGAYVDPEDWNALIGAPDVVVIDTRNDYEVDIGTRSEEHTSELQSLMRISYAVFCLKKKKRTKQYVIVHAN